jgi:hypothetical protein
VGAVRYRFRAEVRTRWKSVVALAEPVVPVLALGLGVVLVLLIADLVAFVPGRIAAGLRPATVLRSE